MSAQAFQAHLRSFLDERFAVDTRENAHWEWRAFQNSPYLYGPKVDIAVGPISDGIGPNRELEFDRLVQVPHVVKFLEGAFDYHVQNINVDQYSEVRHPAFQDILYHNKNGRCFLAIEIENRNSKKHMMGSIVNAASLGRIGIGVGFCEAAMRSLSRLINYMHFLKRVEKNTYQPTNFILLTPEQLMDLFERDLRP